MVKASAVAMANCPSPFNVLLQIVSQFDLKFHIDTPFDGLDIIFHEISVWIVVVIFFY